MAKSSLFGREDELRALRQLIDDVSERGAALLVRGAAGIGKTALLATAARHAAENGVRILTVAGIQTEAHLPYAGLHQLLQPILDSAESLPQPQREALLSAFGLGTAGTSEFFPVALAALELLSETATRAPLLLIVEDVHWLDPATCDVLLFLARRLAAEPIILLGALRDGVPSPFDVGGLPELRLVGLDPVAAGQLLDAHTPGLEQFVRAQLLEQAAGNPLALIELPAALLDEQLRGAAPLPTRLPLSARLERAFAARAAHLPDATRTLLLAAAADDGGVVSEIMSAGSTLLASPATLDQFEPAIEAGLIEIVGTELRFRHPLMRSAMYQAASVSQRRAAHAALAGVLAAQPDRRIWHEAAAAIGPDEAIALGLEEAAFRASWRGAVEVAAAAEERAAALSANPEQRAHRLLVAAMLYFDIGRPGGGTRLLRAVDPEALSQVDRTRYMWTREIFVDTNVWSGVEYLPAFVAMADEELAAGNPIAALARLLQVVLRCWWANPDQSTRDLAVAAAERIPVPAGHPTLLAILAFADPVGRGKIVLDHLSRMPPEGVENTILTLLLGVAATAVGDFARSASWLELAVGELRAQGRMGRVAETLASQGVAYLFLGRWHAAQAVAAEAARLAEETNQPLWVAAARYAEATTIAYCGRHAEAETLAGEAERHILAVGARPMLALVQHARGAIALAAGRYDEAYTQLRRLFDPADGAYHPFVRAWALADLAEAADRSGQREEARAFLAELVPLAERAGWPVLRAALAYALPLLAEDDTAEAYFRAGLAADLAAWPFLNARLHLAYGVWLRRQRRAGESRAPLRTARQVFDTLGAVPWGEWARQELRASGESSRRHTTFASDQLTPQELQVALLAAEGLSNREIGQQLYLSHRTISTHLQRIFPKLGIAGRAELRGALGGETFPLS